MFLPSPSRPENVEKSRMEMADIVTSLPKDGCRLKKM